LTAVIEWEPRGITTAFQENRFIFSSPVLLGGDVECDVGGEKGRNLFLLSEAPLPMLLLWGSRKQPVVEK
jgi:hypothetical protein